LLEPANGSFEVRAWVQPRPRAAPLGHPYRGADQGAHGPVSRWPDRTFDLSARPTWRPPFCDSIAVREIAQPLLLL